MLGRGLFPSQTAAEHAPVRPSTFRETQEERTEPEPKSDYPDSSDDAKLDKPSDYGFQEYADRPVGVYITAPIPSDRPMVEWSAGTMTVSGPTQIASSDRKRKRFYVRNLDAANRIYLSHENTDQNFAGYTLVANAAVEFFHNGPVWARAVSTAVEITFASEYTLEEVKHG